MQSGLLTTRGWRDIMRGRGLTQDEQRAVTCCHEYFRRIRDTEVDIFKGEVTKHVAQCLRISQRSVARVISQIRRPEENSGRKHEGCNPKKSAPKLTPGNPIICKTVA